MTAPHDFEFSFGRHRSLRGRGWRGLLALGMIAIALVVMGDQLGTSVVVPFAGSILHLIFAPKLAN
jgi:hypothetical protein